MGLFSSIFAPGEQARSDELDRQRIALEERRAAMGYITPQQAAANENRIAGERLDVDGEIGTAFQQGAAEGYANTTGFIKDVAAAPFNFTWDIIPWQLLLAAAVALFLYAGGGLWLKGIIARKFK